MIVLYCFSSLKKKNDNESILSHPHSPAPSIKDKESWRWASVTVCSMSTWQNYTSHDLYNVATASKWLVNILFSYIVV